MKTKQFRATPELAGNFALTKRDVDVCKLVYDSRYISSKDIYTLIAGSDEKLKRRLRLLFHHGYLTRPVKQIHKWKDGKKHFIYMLGDAGANALRDSGLSLAGETKKTYWSSRASTKEHTKMYHHMAIAAFRAQLYSAAKAEGVTLEWIPEGDALRDSVTISVYRGRKPEPVPINPDAYATLSKEMSDGKTRRFRIFTEIDLHTEPIERFTQASREKTYLYKKCAAFWQWGMTKQADGKTASFKKHGIKGFVVLIATTTPRHANNIRRALRKLDPRGIGQNMFWLGTFNPADDYKRLLGPIWQTPRDDSKKVSLFDAFR